MDMMDALDIAQALAVAVLLVVALYALSRAFDLSKCLTRKRKEDDEAGMRHVPSDDSPCSGD